jgi:hypothetical protein
MSSIAIPLVQTVEFTSRFETDAVLSGRDQGPRSGAGRAPGAEEVHLEPSPRSPSMSPWSERGDHRVASMRVRRSVSSELATFRRDRKRWRSRPGRAAGRLPSLWNGRSPGDIRR